MKRICVWTALLLFQPALAAGSQGGTGAPQVTGTKAERVAAAANYYAQGDFVRAALGFEGLAADYPGEREYLFNAGASRAGAGHFAHAVAYTREYLARGKPSPTDRLAAEAQLQEAEKSVIKVKVSVVPEPGGTGSLMLVIRYVARESGDVRPELSFPAPIGAMVELALDPGVWEIRAQGPGYEASMQRVEVINGQIPMLSMRVKRTSGTNIAPQLPHSAKKDVSPETIRRATWGFAIGGGLVAATGLALVGVGAAGVGKAEACDQPGDNQGPCTVALRDARLQRDLGIAILGLGGGLLVGGLTWRIRDADRRRRAWIAEAVTGGVMVVAGMILVPVSSTAFNIANNGDVIRADDATGTDPTWSEHYQKYRHSAGHALSSVVFGLGVGTLFSAGTSLGLQRVRTRTNVQLGGMAGRGQLGLTLSGRF